MEYFSKLVKYLWILSFLVFLGFFMLMYVNMPELLRLQEFDQGERWLVTKSNFFYGMLFLMVLLNAGMNILGATLAFVPPQWILLPKKSVWLKDLSSRKILNDRVKGWSRGVALILNLLLLTITVVIFRFNNGIAPDLTFLVYFLLISLVLWKVYWFILFNKIPEELESK